MYLVLQHIKTTNIHNQAQLFLLGTRTSAAGCGTSEAGGGADPAAGAAAAPPDGAGAGVDTVTSSRPGIDANCTTTNMMLLIKCHILISRTFKGNIIWISKSGVWEIGG